MLKKIKKLLFVSLIFFTPSCKKDTLLLSQEKSLGTWFWYNKSKDSSMVDEYLRFAKDNNIDEIFLSDHSLGDDTNKVTQFGSENDIDIYFLLGDVGYMENLDDSRKEVLRFKKYNEENPTHPFKGIHFDVEPIQSELYKNDKVGETTKLINLCYTIKKENPDIIFQYDIPFWLDTEVTYNNLTKPAHQFMIDYADKVYIMSYRDDASRTLSCCEDEVNYAVSSNKTLALSFETAYSDESDKITYYEEGKSYLLSEMNKVKEKLPSNFSLAIHHLASFYSLKD